MAISRSIASEPRWVLASKQAWKLDCSTNYRKFKIPREQKLKSAWNIEEKRHGNWESEKIGKEIKNHVLHSECDSCTHHSSSCNHKNEGRLKRSYFYDSTWYHPWYLSNLLCFPHAKNYPINKIRFSQWQAGRGSYAKLLGLGCSIRSYEDVGLVLAPRGVDRIIVSQSFYRLQLIEHSRTPISNMDEYLSLVPDPQILQS